MKNIIYIFLFAISLFLIGCNSNKNVDEVINLIDNLPPIEEFTIKNENDVLIIKEKINLLTKKEINKISNYNDFKLYEVQLDNLLEQLNIKIVFIEELITILKNKEYISTVDEEQISFIDNKINELSIYEQSFIDNINEFSEIKNKLDDIKKIINEINNSINSLPENISLEDEFLLTIIRSEYEKLNYEDKQLINNINKLEEAEMQFNKLKELESLRNGNALDCINDTLTSDTYDDLIKNTNEYAITWNSSNENLVYFENGYIRVSKVYQTHKKQTVTLSATVKFKDGTTVTSSKEVIVNPVKYEELSNTPVATYYQSTALSSYTSYSERYKQEKTLFSDKAKEVLDIIYFAFGHIDSNGNITLSDPGIVPELNKLKENDVRVLVSIAGISTEGSNIFANLTSDETKLKNFVNNIMNLIEEYNFDGVDVDWESTGDANVLSKGLNNLLKSLREEMNKRQDKGGSDYLLTVAIPARTTDITPDKFDFVTINKYVDYINMMSYELQNNGLTTHGSALYSSSNDNGYGYSVDLGVQLFTKYGLDKNKIIIGVSGFGKTYKLTENSKNEKYPGLGVAGYKTKLPNANGAYASGTVFLVAIDTAKASGKFKEYFEYNDKNQLVGSYLYNETDEYFITYDSVEVIAAKYNYANNNGMGIMCWAYTQDTNDSYVNTIYDLTN